MVTLHMYPNIQQNLKRISYGNLLQIYVRDCVTLVMSIFASMSIAFLLLLLSCCKRILGNFEIRWFLCYAMLTNYVWLINIHVNRPMS